MMPPIPHERPRLGISACLLGRPVRFDGSQARPWLVQELIHLVAHPIILEVQLLWHKPLR